MPTVLHLKFGRLKHMGKILYKFKACEHDYDIEAVVQNKLWVSTLHNMNDPMELAFYINPNDADGAFVQEFQAHITRAFGVISFSKTWKNKQLWNYYSNGFKGMVIAYDSTSIDFAIKEVLHNVSYDKGDVKYENVKYDLTKLYQLFLNGGGETLFPYRSIYTKDTSWRKEHEYRYSLPTQFFGDKIDIITGKYLENIVPSAIYIGYKMNYKNKQKLINYAQYQKRYFNREIAVFLVTPNLYDQAFILHKEQIYPFDKMENFYKKKVLTTALKFAQLDLYNKDQYLIVRKTDLSNEEIHLSERSIVFRFALYLFNRLQNSDLYYYDLDCEYNRNIDLEKKYHSNNGEILGCYPDIIIHKRGTNDDNLLVIEVKTWWNSNTDHDEDKLRDLTKQTSDYRYEYGLSITLGKDENSVKMKWFQNGVEIE